MDLLDFSDCELYFDVPMPAAAEQLLAQASAEYGDPSAETALLRAHLLAPENLAVLVGLYRYYFYQHRLDDADRRIDPSQHLVGAGVHQHPCVHRPAGEGDLAQHEGGVLALGLAGCGDDKEAVQQTLEPMVIRLAPD